VESTPPSYHKSRVEFEGQGGGDSWFKLEDAEGGGTKTAWGMAFDVPWPFNFFMAVTGSSSMNEMFEKGLAGLKELAEQKAAEAPAAGSKYEVKEMDFPGQHYLGIREKISFEKMADPAFYGERFGQIQAVMQKAKMEIAGYPTNVYYVWDDANKMTDMAIALPTQSAAAVSGKNIASFEIPAGKALVVDYYGPYEGIADAHIAMDEYIKAKGWQQKSPVLEQYVTDPGTEPDTSKWLTKVLYFVGK
jgi:effector-binding domain-containing protein